jgi:hypothetical protein
LFNVRCVEERIDDDFACALAGGREGSSPVSGSNPGPGFVGSGSDTGRAGSSISPALRAGKTVCEGKSSPLTTAKAAIRASEMIASRFMRQDQRMTGHCRIWMRTARRGSIDITACPIRKSIDSGAWLRYFAALIAIIPLIMISKRHPRLAPLAAAICLNSLLLIPKVLADDISAVDVFDRDLSLVRMGQDIVNLDQQGVSAESFKATKNG